MKIKPLGSLIDELNTLREKRRKIGEEDKKLELEYKALDEQIRVRLEAEGMDKATGKLATVSITKCVVPTVKNWDLLCKWVKRSNNFQFFQRRISSEAFREFIEVKKITPPGLEAFEQTKLNLRALS